MIDTPLQTCSVEKTLADMWIQSRRDIEFFQELGEEYETLLSALRHVEFELGKRVCGF